MVQLKYMEGLHVQVLPPKALMVVVCPAQRDISFPAFTFNVPVTATETV